MTSAKENNLSDAEWMTIIKGYLPREDRNHLDPKTSQATALTLRRLLVAYAARMGTALELYKPLPSQLAFHQSMARFAIVRGTNRAGKTLAASIEAIMICLGSHPWKSGVSVPKTDGKLQVVGKDAPHLADPLWRTLYYPGAFYLVPDEKSGELRRLEVCRKTKRLFEREWRRQSEWRPSPPLITDNNLAKQVAYSDKAKGIPNRVVFKSGWEMKFHTAEGNPRQGGKNNAAWFDEEIPSMNWWRETQRGLVDHNGIFWWSASPQQGAVPLFALHQRGLDGDPQVAEFFLAIQDNPYLSEAAKEDFYRSLLSEEDIRVCWFGDYPNAGYMVYSEVDVRPGGLHHAAWDTSNPPADWMRVLATDPGYRTTATVIAALAPPDERGFNELHVYDELYLRGTAASEWAPQLADKLVDAGGCREVPELHVFDMAFGRTRTVAGKSVVHYYEKAAAEVGITNRIGGSRFVAGNSDVLARTAAAKDALKADASGNVRVRIDPDRCPNLIRELGLQRWKQGGREKRESVDDHLVDAFEYLLAYPLKYRRPAPPAGQTLDPERFYREHHRHQKEVHRRGLPQERLRAFKRDRFFQRQAIFRLTPYANHRVYYGDSAVPQ